jgi:hypothetical protein
MIELTKLQKIALLITFHSQVVLIEEGALMLLIAWVVNGVDTQIKDGKPRIDWAPYLQFAEDISDSMAKTPEETSDEPDPAVV